MYPHLPIPTEIAFEPVNLCNAKCFCCPYSWLGEDKNYTSKKMSHEQIELLMNDFAGLLKKYNVAPWTAHIQPWRYSDPLVCKDLEMICEIADKNKIQVIITTNGISFTEKNCKIIDKYKHLIKKLNISIIGFNDKEIREQMGVNWEVTKQRLLKVKKDYPEVSKLMRIGLKHRDYQTIDNAMKSKLRNDFQRYTLGIVKVKTNWLNNRLGDGDGKWVEHKEFAINEKNFVQGCAMDFGKIFRRLEVLVDGSAVLCCDDVDGKTNYGNVFEIGIEGVWANLRNAHKLIFDKQYSKAKENLICNSCARARFKWNDSHKQGVVIQQTNVANQSNLSVTYS